MKLIIFFIYMPFVYSELHTFRTTYTGIRGKTTKGTPKFSAVTTLDEQQIDYYDSDIKKLIPRQDWMKEYASKELWKEDIVIRKHVQQIYKNNIPVIMQRFNQSDGVHTYQRMYGCIWDDETNIKYGFDQYGYDGEDFITLDLKNRKYIASVPQANSTVMKWNNNLAQLEFQVLFQYDCVYWMEEFLHSAKTSFERTVLKTPEVSLLQRNPADPVKCHVTGFHYRNTSIFWRKKGETTNNFSKLVKSGDTLPNEDGTFQRTVTLYVLPDEWKKDQYLCVVEHKNLTEPIQKILTESGIKSNNKPAAESTIIITIIGIVVVIGVFCLIAGLIYKFCPKKQRWLQGKSTAK